MSSAKDNDLNYSNYKKLAQFEAALSVDLSNEPKYFENLLNWNQDFDINYRIPKTCFIESSRSSMIGSTLLTITLDNFEIDMFKILLKRGADLTNADNYGCTVVHDLIGNNLAKQLKSMKSYTFTPNNQFAKIALKAHIDFNITKNPCNSYGLSHFHIACMMNDNEVVEYFLANNTPVDQTVHKDSSILPGYAALHFAVKYGAYESTKLLLNYGVNINFKDERGMSALHVLIEERMRTWPAFKRCTMTDSSSSFSILEEYFGNNEKILMLFLTQKRASTYNDDIGFSSLHAASTLQDTSLIEELLLKSNANINDSVKADSFIWPGYTALHFAAHFSAETFKLLLKKGADMEAQDSKRNTPFDICLLSFSVTDIHTILSYHPTWKNILFSDGKTKLLDLIGAMKGASVFTSFVAEHITNINMFIPLDSPICAGYTPLHLAVICSEKPPDYNDSEDNGYPTVMFNSFHPRKTTLYGIRITTCLSMGANIAVQDARGSTPLHWAFYLQETSVVKLLLAHHKEFDNPINDVRLSHLHIACASKIDLIVMKLLLTNRSDVNSQAKADYSWYPGYSRTIVKSGSTPLHFAVECPKITEILLRCGADILVTDDEGFNPLERVLGSQLTRDYRLEYYRSEYDEDKQKVLLLLIPRMIIALIDSAEGPEKLLRCYDLLNPKFLMTILESNDEMRDKILDKVGLTRLHVACIKNNADAVRKLLLQRDIDINARVHHGLPIWSGFTPLFCYLEGRALRSDKSNDFSVAKLLLEHGADVMVKNGTRTVLHKAFELLSHRQMPYELEVPREKCEGDEALVKLLLSYCKDFSDNFKVASGLSHLHIACACNNVDMVEGLLKNGADVNDRIDYFCQTYGGDTPLHFSVIFRSKETFDLLLKYGADVHSTNSYDSTPLHTAAKISSQNLDIFKALLNAGADVNAENIVGATPVQLLMEYTNFNKDQIDLFLKNGFRPNFMNPVTKEGGLAMALKENQDNEFVYEMFVKSTDVKEVDGKNRNAIHNVVSCKRPHMDDIDRDTVDEAFIAVEDYIKAIKEFMKLNLNIDQQDWQGKTPLHYAAQMQNVTAILGLLNSGTDFNIKDETDKTAFAYSVEIPEETPSHCNNYEDVDDRIIQIFASHAHKLVLLNLDIDVVNLELKEHVLKKYSITLPNVEDCRNELAKIRKARIKSCPIALNDFLCETGAVVGLSRLPLETREATDQFFRKKSNHLRRKYPEHAGILILQYRKALKRVKLIPPALASIDVVLGFNVPLVCSDIILTFLSNSDLKNLIVAADN